MLIQGDARHLPLRERSVHCVVTSPPYWGLRDYKVAGQLGLEPTPDLYVARLVEVFREVKRVLRDDGTLWLNLGDSYAAAGISSPHNGLADAGAHSPDAMRRTLAELATHYPRRTFPAGLKPKDLVGIPWRVAFALQADGWYLRSDIIWSKPNPMPESVTDRPTKAHEYLFLLAKSERYYYDAAAIQERGTGVPWNSANSAFAKPGAKGQEAIANGLRTCGGDTFHPNIDQIGRNRRSVWTIATQPYPEAHFATFPEDLVSPCVLAGCPHGGRVLDPFAGSGTVGEVCAKLGRRAVLVELAPHYMPLARARTAQMGLV